MSKFCDLRPPHVYLLNRTPHNMCYCLYHSNFIECCSSLNKYINDFPPYGKELMTLLLCSVNNEKCWLRKCGECSAIKIKKTLESIIERSYEVSAAVTWIVWEKDDSGKRFIKRSMNGSIEELLNHFIAMIDKFLIHSYIKRVQAEVFEMHRQHLTDDSAILQVDFAENFTCVAQDEIQSAHWNQKTVSPFSIPLRTLRSDYGTTEIRQRAPNF